MKLLFDENLPHSLVSKLADVFPGSIAVKAIDLPKPISDAVVWAFAKENGLAIATKDGDFQQRSFLYGQPPKVVWLQCGNASVERLQAMFRRNSGLLLEFHADPSAALVVIH